MFHNWYLRMNMTSKAVYLTISFLILCIGCGHVLAADPEIYIIAADDNGSSNYLISNGDGTLSEPVFIDDLGQQSYSHGIGDFDNDGNFEYITATGIDTREIYLYDKTEDGTGFSEKKLIGTWIGSAEEIGPGNIVVADFNEDEKFDFIVTHYGSPNSDLFLGNGDLTFTGSVLSNTEPAYSVGADANDINNDGHMDYVVMPYPPYDEQGPRLYINLGNGDGTFTTTTLTIPDLPAYWGLALAEVNNDNKVDMICTIFNTIDIYKGDGKGLFTSWKTQTDERIGEFPPVGNYDLDGDGDQDLVIGNTPTIIGPEQEVYGVSVFLNKGNGNFEFLASYEGGSGVNRNVVAPPPSLQTFSSNQPPIASVTPSSKTITAGDEVSFDASGSSDPDGAITSYDWVFGDGSTGTGSKVKHRFFKSGGYTVTVTVTDTMNNQATATSTITVKAIKANINFLPKILNLDSEKEYVTIAITLPKQYDVKNINLDKFGVRYDKSPITWPINARTLQFSCHFEKGKNGLNTLIVQFDKSALVKVIPEPSPKTILHVTGTVRYAGGNAAFEGSDTIRTIIERKKSGNNVHWRKE